LIYIKEPKSTIFWPWIW